MWVLIQTLTIIFHNFKPKESDGITLLTFAPLTLLTV